MLYLAIKQMLARKKQTFLIMLGISFGTMIYVIIAGVQLGMRNYIREQLLNNTAHVIIKGKEDYVEQDAVEKEMFGKHEFVSWLKTPAGKRHESRLNNPQGWFRVLDDEVEVHSYAPRFSIDSILSKGDAKHAVSLIGIIPEKQTKVTSIEANMKEGSLLDLSSGGNRIVLGTGVLKVLGVQVGDTIDISIGLGEKRPFKIVGKIRMGNKDMDERLAFAHIKDVQNLNHSPGRISEISVALNDIDKSEEMASRLALYSDDQVESWQEANKAFMQIINIQDVVRLVVCGSILIVASFGIYNVLSIMIAQKQKEIAILRSMGFGPAKILQLFFYQGSILGMAGGIVGPIMGHFFNLGLESIDLGFEIGQGNHLLISYDTSIYVTAFVSGQISAWLASFLPAHKASKLSPMDIIRSNL